jgi:hypothetical protein
MDAVERSIETQVSQAVDAWLRWLPRWEPATHRGRVAPCRRCIGSPVLSAAGLGADVPHGVQHGLSTRVKTIVDHAVAEYTSRNLPLLQAELDQQAARNRARSYRPAEGLDPEFDGLPMDPDPVPGAPFLFTIGGLAEEVDADIPALPPLTEEAKAALRQEVGLADDYANMVGREVCAVLLHHRLRIQAAVAQYVEPQIAAMLEELTRSLDAPFDPNPFDPNPDGRRSRSRAAGDLTPCAPGPTARAAERRAAPALLALPGLRRGRGREAKGGAMTRRLPSAPPLLPGLDYVRPLGSGGFADVFLYQQDMPRRRSP